MIFVRDKFEKKEKKVEEVEKVKNVKKVKKVEEVEEVENLKKLKNSKKKGYQMKAHDERITNKMFHLLYCLFTFVNINKQNRKNGFSRLSEVKLFRNLVDAFNSTQ